MFALGKLAVERSETCGLRSCIALVTPHPSADERLTPSPTGEGLGLAVATFVAVGQIPQVADYSTSL